MRQLSSWGEVFYVTEEHEDIVDAVLTKGRSLSDLDRLLFESADFEVAGNAILERHENYSPDGVPESLRLDNLLLRFPEMPKEKLLHYRNLMLETELTYPVAVYLLHGALRNNRIDEALSWLEAVAGAFALDKSPDRDVLDVQREQLEEELGMPTYGYHKAGEMFEAGEPTPAWFDQQPHPVQRLLTTPKRCTSLDQLKRLGKRCYETDQHPDSKLTDYQQVYVSMSNVQRSVFWGQYNIRKQQLTPNMPPTRAGLALLKRIENADAKSLNRFKGTLYKIQHGIIRMRDPPADYEWTTLWSKVREKESPVQAPDDSVPPDGYSRCGYCYVRGGEMYRPADDAIPPVATYSPSQSVCHCLDCKYF